jgi:hypothetical protein
MHLPFAFACIDILRPKLVVELGTQKGASYCGFCEAASILHHDMRAYAVDHWHGDVHTGVYADDVLPILRKHHDQRYSSFSTLMQSTFDDAVSHFTDRSIDLLHIDGLHTYEAVRHDFETWLPKLSPRAVVLMHDTEVREKDFGVWRLWGELEQAYPALNFPFGYGLGILIVGTDVAEDFVALTKLSAKGRDLLFKVLGAMGQRVQYRHENQVLATQLAVALEREQYLQKAYLEMNKIYLDYRKSSEEQYLVMKKVYLDYRKSSEEQMAWAMGLIKDLTASEKPG